MDDVDEMLNNLNIIPEGDSDDDMEFYEPPSVNPFGSAYPSDYTGDGPGPARKQRSKCAIEQCGDVDQANGFCTRHNHILKWMENSGWSE